MNESAVTNQSTGILKTAKVPENLGDVTDTIVDSFLSIWARFLEHTPYILASIIILILTWIIAKIGLNIARRSLRHSKLRGSLKDLFLRFISFGIWTLGISFSAMLLFPGLTAANALGALGLLSIAIGLAFKDIFENFFAGILLLWQFPFENGDYIECEGLMGYVEKIQIRDTLIRKVTGELAIVPNSFLFKNPVDVLTNKIHRRITLTTRIAFDEDVTAVIEVITRAIADCETVIHDMPLQVWPSQFGASSIDIETTWWTHAKPIDIRRSTGEVITIIKKALDTHGIEIPPPYQMMTFKKPLEIKNSTEEK